jgi:hypothetical protein
MPDCEIIQEVTDKEILSFASERNRRLVKPTGIAKVRYRSEKELPDSRPRENIAK